MVVAGTAVVGLGASAIKMAGDFQTGLTTLVTGAGESQKNIKMIGDGILAMSPQVGQMTDDLIKAEFLIDSAGQHGIQSLQTLKDAAEGAKVGAASLADVANGATTEMTDYAGSHLTSAQAVNDLIATTAEGKTHLGDLANAMASILPTASAMGVSLEDVSGAMATMTSEGAPAADAATYLRQTLMSLESPGKAAQGVLNEIGLSASDVSDEMKISLPGTLAMIEDHLKNKFPEGSAAYVDALKTISGGSKTFQGMLELTGSHLQTFSGDVKDITQKVKDGGTSIIGWTEVQKDFNFQLDQAHAAFDAVLIKVGQQLMPILSTFISNVVMPAVGHFQDWATHTNALRDGFQLLTNVAGALVQDVQNLVGGIASFIGWVQQGGPGVDALAGGLSAVGTAIGLIKIEDFAAGIFNSVQGLNGFKGVIADVATNALPNLGQALGWAKTNAAETAVAVGSIGPAAQAAETEVSVAAIGMSGALAIATGGISLLVGGVVALITASSASGTSAVDKMSADTRKAYNDLGSSAADTSAKQKAASAEVSTDGVTQSTSLASHWQASYTTTMKNADDASAKMILDQQAVADAAKKAASDAENRWQEWYDMMKGMGYNPSVSSAPVTVAAGTHGGHIIGHAAGIFNNPVGHYASLAEAGGEWMHIPNPTIGYVPQGASVLPHGMTPGSSGGGSQQVNMIVDGQTLARIVFSNAPGIMRPSLGLVGV